MVTKVRAIYENGHLRLLEPVDWPEHAEFKVSVEPAGPDRLGQLLKEIASLGPYGRGTPEVEAYRRQLIAELREEMFGDDPEVGTPQEELAKVLGFDPEDEERLAELGRAQSRAILSAFPFLDTPNDITSADDLDAIIYS